MEINSVAWNPATEYILATGSADCVIIIIDMLLLLNNMQSYICLLKSFNL